jgi:hypothetical protein
MVQARWSPRRKLPLIHGVFGGVAVAGDDLHFHILFVVILGGLCVFLAFAQVYSTIVPSSNAPTFRRKVMPRDSWRKIAFSPTMPVFAIGGEIACLQQLSLKNQKSFSA